MSQCVEIIYRYSHGFVPAVIPWIVSGFYFTLVTQVLKFATAAVFK